MSSQKTKDTVFTLNLQTSAHPRLISNVTYGSTRLCPYIKKSDSGFHRSMTSLTIRKGKLFQSFYSNKIFGSQIITTLCFHGGRDKEIDYIA